MSIERDSFGAIAHDLLAGLAPGSRIAVEPFRAADVPVPLGVAQGFNDSIARAIETAPDGGVIVARQELPKLFAEAEEFDAAAGVQKLLEASRADVLVVGRLAPAAGGVQLIYKAIDAKTGRELASAPPRFRAVDTLAPRGMPLDQAVASAAEALASQTADMKTVETLGVYYQQSEVQTPLGAYVSRALVGRLQEKIAGLQAMPATLLRPEAVGQLDEGGTEQAMVRAKPGVFLLSGTVWDLGTDVEVRLSLQGDAEHAAATSIRIRRDAIPQALLPLAPAAEEVSLHNGLGPFALQLSSDRGRRPVYRAGDSAHLVIQAARDGFLYCFHQSSPAAGGGITRIFPNPYHADARIHGAASVHIPDEGMGFALKVQGPAGVEHVRCFAADRDVAAAMSPGVLGRGLEPLALHSLGDLDRVFRAVPAAVSEASMVMTIDAGQ